MTTASERAGRIAQLGYDYAAQPREAVSECNLCGFTVWTVLTHTDRYGFPARATACQQCGLTVLNPRMNGFAYGDFYKSVYRPLVSAYHGRLIDASTIQEEQREYAAAMVDLVAPYITGSGSLQLLDVGGSTGVVAAAFVNRFGMEATVLDPAPDEVVLAGQFGMRTITSLVEDWVPDSEYDVIGMFQTVDHLLDVAQTFEKLRGAIKPDGLFIIDIVDFRAAYLRNRSVEAAVKIDHPYYLTEDTVELYFRRYGFDPILKSFSADHLHVAYVCKPIAPEATVDADALRVREFMREVRSIQNTPLS